MFVITKSNWGGAQQYVYTLATRFQEAGAEVAVALGGTGEKGAPAGLLNERLETAGVRTIFLKSFMRDVGLTSEYAAFFELLRIIRLERPDVLHLNSSKAGGIGALAGRLLGIRRIVFTAHGWAHREPRSFFSRTLIRLASWATVALAHRVIAVSELDKNDAPVLISRKKISVVRNGVRKFPLLSRQEARTKLAPAAEMLPFWFLTLAELHPNKGLDTLVKAFAEAKESLSDTALIIAGAGELHSELNLLALTHGVSDRVFFAGFVPEGREYLRAGDALVLSSRKEGFPFSILEAGMAGVPVVATCAGAIPEAVEDGKSGLLVPIDDIGALARALLRIHEDAALRARLADALKERVAAEFSEASMLAATMRAYLN